VFECVFVSIGKGIEMKKMCVLTFGFVVLSAVGCGGASSSGKDQVAAINEMSSIMDGIKDDKSAEEALPKLEKAATKAREAGEKVAAGKLSEDEATKYAKEVGEARAKMQASATKAASAAPGKSKQIVETLGKAAPKNVKMP
jgi:hypothetical protein